MGSARFKIQATVLAQDCTSPETCGEFHNKCMLREDAQEALDYLRESAADHNQAHLAYEIVETQKSSKISP